MAATQYFEQVQKIFIAFYQRPADPAGLKYWAQRVDAAGGDFGAVIDAFASSPEAVALYGAIDATTIGTVIDSLYLALFNRVLTADDAGKQFYVDGFAAGTFTAGTIALAVLNGAQNDDLIAVNNKVQVANEFTQQVDGRPLTDAYFGTGAGFNVTYAGDADAQAARDILKGVTFDSASVINPSQVTEELKAKIADATDPIIGQTGGKTFTLTTSIDNLTGTGGNDTFTGVFSAAGTTTGADGTSLNAADILNGAGGTDTVSYIVLGDANGKGASSINPLNVTNVEQFTVRNLATDSVASSEEVHTLNLANVTGVTGVTNKGSSAGVNFQNIGKNASVTVDGVTAGNTTFTRGTTAITEALTINIANGVKAGDIQSVDTNNDATSVVINSTGGKNVVGAVEVTGSGGANHTATSVTINAASDLTIGTAGGGADLTGFDTTKAGTITVTGAGKVVLNDLAGVVKTLNAGANTGGVTATGLAANLQEVTGGAGKDSITLGGALADKGFVKLGAGNDKLNIAAFAVDKGAVIELGDGDDTLVGTGAVSKDAVVDGGAGKDTLAAGLVNAVNIGAFANFENLDLAGLNVVGGLDADLFSAKNTIEKLILSDNAGASAIINNVTAGVGLEVTASSSNAVTIGQKGVTAAGTVVDKFTVTFNAPAAEPVAAKTVTVAGITLNSINEVTIVSGGGEKVSNVLTSLVSDEMKTLVITGDKALTLNGLYTTGTTATTVLKTIDASGQTAGGLKMALGAVNGDLTLKLGGGDDVITAGFKSDATVAADSTATALDKIANFDKATSAELTAATGYDLVKLVDANGTPATYAVAANTTGTTTAAGINNGVISFAALTSGPQNFADAVAAVDTAVATVGNAVIFEYGANSYLFVENGTADLVVELTGLTAATKLGLLGADSLYVM